MENALECTAVATVLKVASDCWHHSTGAWKFQSLPEHVRADTTGTQALFANQENFLSFGSWCLRYSAGRHDLRWTCLHWRWTYFISDPLWRINVVVGWCNHKGDRDWFGLGKTQGEKDCLGFSWDCRVQVSKHGTLLERNETCHFWRYVKTESTSCHVLLNCMWSALVWESRNNELNVKPAFRGLQSLCILRKKNFVLSLKCHPLEIQMFPYLSVTLWGKADSPSSRWQMSWAHKEMFLKILAFFRNLPLAPSFCSHTAICDSSPHTYSSSLILSVGSGKRAPNVSTRQRLLLLLSSFIISLAGIINLVPWEHKEVNNTPPSCGRLSITNDEGAFGRQGDAADWSQGIRAALHDKRVHQDRWA